MKKEIYVYLANDNSEFDTGTIVQLIDQTESDSYFRGIGIIEGIPKIVDQIFFDDIDFIKLTYNG